MRFFYKGLLMDNPCGEGAVPTRTQPKGQKSTPLRRTDPGCGRRGVPVPFSWNLAQPRTTKTRDLGDVVDLGPGGRAVHRRRTCFRNIRCLFPTVGDTLVNSRRPRENLRADMARNSPR